MKIGGHFSSGDGDLFNSLQQAHALNAKAVQLFLGSQTRVYPSFYSPEYCYNFKSSVASYEGLEVAAHAPYVLNIVYPGSLYSQSINSIVKHLILCDYLGIKYFVVHPGSSKDLDKNLATIAFKSALQTIQQQLPSGIKSKLLIENVAGGGTQYGSIEEITTSLGSLGPLPNIGMCFDSAHAFASGIDMTDAKVRKYIRALIDPYVCWMHFNNPDTDVSLGSHKDRHSFSWDKSKWPDHVMIDIAKEFGDKVPLCMEARQDRAYDYNFMICEENNLI